jgi:hypothetical protein
MGEAADSIAMSRFAVKSSDRPLLEPSTRSSKVLSLLLILEALAETPGALKPQKV